MDLRETHPSQNQTSSATNAQPYITPINLATPATYLITKYSQYSIEWDVTTAGGGTAQLFGVFIDMIFNYA